MDTNDRTQEKLTCGEYLNIQRSKLDQFTDLGVPGAKDAVKELLANIYAVNYQMMYERVEPPGPDRGPATREALDRELVGQVSHALRSAAPEFQDIMDDSTEKPCLKRVWRSAKPFTAPSKATDSSWSRWSTWPISRVQPASP